jgi:hypothetical protein
MASAAASEMGGRSGCRRRRKTGTHSSSSTAGCGCKAALLLLLLLLLAAASGCWAAAAAARRARILQARQHGALFVCWKRAMRGRAGLRARAVWCRRACGVGRKGSLGMGPD